MDERYSIKKGKFTDTFDVFGDVESKKIFSRVFAEFNEDQLANLGNYFVATDNETGEKVGYAHGARDLVSGERWLKTILVQENHRNRGIGTELAKLTLASFEGDEPIYTMLTNEDITRIIERIDDDRLKY